MFILLDFVLFNVVSKIGIIISSVYVLNCFVIGDGLKKVLKSKGVFFVIYIKDYYGDLKILGGDLVECII